MDFARKQLEKYGWKDGKGLGKNENGISQALKPKLKRSMTGVGHNAASDFTEHWWNTLYNKAASNIEVKEKDGTTKKIKTKDDTAFEITNSTWKLKRKKSDLKSQEQYEDFFVRTAVLGSGGSRTERVRQSESESEEDPLQKDVFKMTDEELFAACEGRTAHKGARHGLKALGKLARVEQQEKLLLQQSRYNGYSHANKAMNKEYEQEVMEIASVNCDVPNSKKKKKKKHCLKQDMCDDVYSVNNSTIIKLKEKQTNCDVVEKCDGVNTGIIDEFLPQKIKKKKASTIGEQLHVGKISKMNELDLQNNVLSSDRERKKRKHLQAIDNETCDSEINSYKRKYKKNKKTVVTY